MITNKSTLQVRYSETDQMGFVYYGNYAQYLEVGRVNLMKQIGFSYRKMEESGYFLPVRDFNIRYHKAARYDETLTIITTIDQMPTNRVTFNYRIELNEALLAEASTTLFFMDKNNRPTKPPVDFINKLASYFN
jgi:acyl-CoA thioester hydrolase